MAEKKLEARMRPIQIPAQPIGRITVWIEHETRVVVHRFGPKAKREMEDKQQKAARSAKAPRDPESEFREAMYTFPDKPGKQFVPGAWFKKAMVRGAKSLDNVSMTDAREYVRVLDEHVELVGSKPQMREDMVRIPGTTTVRYRPEFLHWKAEIHLLYNYRFFSPSQVVAMLASAGTWGGVGEGRPQKGSGLNWGLFKVTQAGGTDVPKVKRPAPAAGDGDEQEAA